MIDFVAYKQWNLFLTVQEFGKSKIRVWWEDASWLIGGWLLNVLIPGGGKRALWGLIHKVTDTIHETSTLLNHVPETSPPNTITLAIRILTHESAGCGDTNTQSIGFEPTATNLPKSWKNESGCGGGDWWMLNNQTARIRAIYKKMFLILRLLFPV